MTIIKTVALETLAAEIPNAFVDGPFGSNLKLSDYVSDGIPVLQGKNITGNKFKWFDIRFISEKKANELKRSAVREGDILIIKIGSIGYSAILDDLKGYPFGIIPANFCKITPDLKKVDLKYLIYCLNSTYSVKYLINNASATAQPALKLSTIKNLPVPLPPLDEQKHIADILSRADRMRQLRRYAREMSDGFLQAVFLEMFGDPVKNPMGWEVAPVKDISLSVTAGPFGSSIKKECYVQEGYRVYGQEQVIPDNYNIGDYYIDNYKFDELKRYEVKPYDLLISLVGSFGKISVVPPDIKPGIMNPRLLRIRLIKEKCSPYFFKYCFVCKPMKNYLEHLAHGGTMGILNAGIIKELNIILPPIEIQKKFYKTIQQYMKIQFQQAEAERQVEQLFQSLLHRAFRGEL